MHVGPGFHGICKEESSQLISNKILCGYLANEVHHTNMCKLWRYSMINRENGEGHAFLLNNRKDLPQAA